MGEHHKRLTKIILLSLFSLALVALFSNFFFYRFFFALGQENTTELQEEQGDSSKNSDEEKSSHGSDSENSDAYLYLEDKFSRDMVNIMFLGIDRCRERQREGRQVFFPDTIKIVSMDMEEDRVRLISVLRDTYTYLPDADVYDKISNAYVYAYKENIDGNPHHLGTLAVKRALQNLLGGLPIHYYATINMDGASKIVDALGGVEYSLEEPLRDDFGTGEVIVPQGRERLDGEEFLYLLRYRGKKGDAWRVERQQEILQEVLAQMQAENGFAEIPRIYSILRKNVNTDLSTGQIGFLAMYSAGLEAEQFEAHILESSKGISQRNDSQILYAVPDEEHRVELMEDLFGMEDVSSRTGIEPPGYRPLENDEALLDYRSPVLLEDALP